MESQPDHAHREAHVRHCWKKPLDRIERGEIDPDVVVSHRSSLDDAPDAFNMFLNQEDGCIKVVLKP